MFSFQWNLVCEQQWYAEHSQLLYSLGWLFGAFVSGQLTDQLRECPELRTGSPSSFGRKPITLVSCFLAGFCGVILSIVPIYSAFACVRFLVATFVMASWMALYTLGWAFLSGQLYSLVSKYRSRADLITLSHLDRRLVLAALQCGLHACADIRLLSKVTSPRSLQSYYFLPGTGA